MNTWGNDQFAMQNIIHGVPNMIPPHGMAPPHAMAPPMVQPYTIIGDQNMQMQPIHVTHVDPAPPTGQFIGPVIPENASSQVETVAENEDKSNDQDQTQTQDKRQSRERNDRRERERERERGRRRSRSRNRDRDYSNKERNSRGDRNRNSNEHRDRYTKWDNKVQQQLDHLLPQNNMMMPGQQNMMQYGNMMQNMQNPMLNQQMDISNMQHIMPGMNMMANNMIPNNMPNNMMMMNQQLQMTSQHIYFSNGVIFPALPGTTIPQRREKPPGCRTIFIGGLPTGISEDNITEIFQRFGSIDEVKMHKQRVCHVRFENLESVELSFCVSGSRIKLHDQLESEATTLFIDYALNRADQSDFEKNKRKRASTPPRIEQFTAANLVVVGEKIKSDNEFAEAAPTLVAWLERGDCNKKNANTFYSLIQASNNQLRRLFNEKMQIDDEYQTLRTTIRDRFGHIILQFEQVAKILKAAKIQRVSDHFSKQQRRNIEMWLKMTEELDNIKDEFNAIFDEEEMEKGTNKSSVSLEKYEQLKAENENLVHELEGYKNEAHLAKDEAERKFETFKAHFIAQQALQHNKQVFLPSLPLPVPNLPVENKEVKPQPPPPLPEDVTSTGIEVNASEAKLISLLSAFLMVHPLGASLDYLVSYVRSLAPNVTHSTVHEVLKKYSDVFCRKTTGVGASVENKWFIVIFDGMKME